MRWHRSTTHPNLVRLLGYRMDMNPAAPHCIPTTPRPPLPLQVNAMASKHHSNLVNAMASKHHPNLVRLLGFCIDFNAGTEEMEQVVVYEFMENGDLDRWIGDGKISAVGLSFGVVMLAVITAQHAVRTQQDTGSINLKAWVSGLAVCVPMAHHQLWGGDAGGDNSTACSAHPAGHGQHQPQGMAQHAVRTQQDTGSINLKAWVSGLAVCVPMAHHQLWGGDAGVAARDVASFKDPRLEGPADLILRLAELALSCTAMPTASRPDMMRIIGDLKAMRAELAGGDVDERAVRIDSELAIGVGETLEEQILRVESMGDDDRGAIIGDTPDVPVLLNCQALWIRNFTGWTTGKDCQPGAVFPPLTTLHPAPPLPAPSPVPVLLDCQALWIHNFTGWTTGEDCQPGSAFPSYPSPPLSTPPLPPSPGSVGLPGAVGPQLHGMDDGGGLPALWIRNFTGWTTGEDCATAEGLQCDSNGMIVKMSMEMSSLAGVLPSSIGNLTLLTHLNFFQNNLDSDIPTTFGALTNLQHLNLGINMLTGPLPLFLDTLSLLTFLNLGDNKLTGTLSAGLGNLKQLQFL
ncbi:unnamed protein product, partial [Closterium sp. Naga37s-1]